MPPPPAPSAGSRANGAAPPSGPRSAPALPSSSASTSESIDPSIDLASIKARYLGIADPNKKRKARKISDKKFVFDWDGDEDTAADVLATASGVGGTGVMLGGSVGGIADTGRGRDLVVGKADQ